MTNSITDTNDTFEELSDSQREALGKLNADLRTVVQKLSRGQARYLVDTYYQQQEFRKRAMNQQHALIESGEPNEVVAWLTDNERFLETQIKRALAWYADQHPLGQWAQSIPGIGPVLAAGLLAYLDEDPPPTVGHWWRFAGLDPTMVWEKGQKRPYSANLKVLCWKIGESFVKVSTNDKDIYGKVYRERRAYEDAKNEAGDYADQAAASLSRFVRDTVTKSVYEQGKLPPARLHARAKRYAVKLFLSHYHHVAFSLRYGQDPPKPYIISAPNADPLVAAGLRPGHVHFIAPPHFKDGAIELP